MIGVLFALSVAQAPMGVMTQAEADGFKVGDAGRIHLYGNLDLKLDTNPVFLPPGTLPAVTADLALRIRAGMILKRPSETLELSLAAHADWTQWMGVVNPRTRELSTFQALIDFSMLANKDGKVTFSLNERLSRDDIPANAAINQRLRSLRTVTSLGTDIRPGSRALEFRAGYMLDFAFYDRDQISVLSPDALTYMTHVPSLRGLWRFFPKTAVVVEAQGGITHYPLQAPPVQTPNLYGLRALAGVQGAITEKLTVVAKVGYGNTFASGGLSNFSNVIAQAGLTWKPTDTTTLGLGYARDFAPVPVFGWYSYDKPFIDASQLLFGRVIASLKAQYMFQMFGTPQIPGIAERRDHVILGEVRVGVQIQRWLATSVYYAPDIRLSNFVSPSGVSGAYQRHVIGLDITGGY